MVVYTIPWSSTIKPGGPRLAGLFLATIVGSVIEPIPAAALVLIAITLSAILGILPIEQALGGYADRTVWLVMTAFFLSRGLINTGLARRIALTFVRWFGKSSLGVCYSLGLSDFVLAAMIPANGARAGGRDPAHRPLHRRNLWIHAWSHGQPPGVLLIYGGVPIGVRQHRHVLHRPSKQPAGRPLRRRLRIQGHVAQLVRSRDRPRSAVAAGSPLGSDETEPAGAEAHARSRRVRQRRAQEDGLDEPQRNDRRPGVHAGVRAVDLLLLDQGRHHRGRALLGGALLLLTGILSWEDVKGERAAWDVFIWFGGLFRLGQALNDSGVTRAFADMIAHRFNGLGWAGLFAVALVIYYYAHYGFASITAHMVSMFPPFLAVLLAKGAPPGIVVYGFACFANLSACLTHFGTTPGPIFFADGYVSLKTWWKVGAVVSVVNLIIWTTVGFGWWKLIGIW